MPVARRYGPQQVGTAALPGARKTAYETTESLGGGVARAKGQLAAVEGQAAGQKAEAVAGFGGFVSQIATSEYHDLVKQQRDHANEVWKLEMSNRLDSWENSRMYGDGSEANPGALSRKGKAALTLPEELAADWTEYTGNLESTASNDEQRFMFQQLKAQRGQNIDATIRRHVFGEMQTYEATELKAAIENRVSSAVRNATDIRRVGVELGELENIIKTHGPRAGAGPEAVDAQLEAVRSAVHTGVIDRLLTLENPKAAGIYFEETRDQIAGDKIADIEKALEEGSLRKTAQDETEKILAQGGTLTEQRERAKAIDDRKVRDEVTSRLEHEAGVREREERVQDEDRLRGAFDVLDKEKNVSKIPPAVWAKLDGNQRASLKAYADHINDIKPIKTDVVKYYSLMRQAADDPQAFATRNLLEFRGSLDEVEFKQLAGLQLSIRNSDTKKAEADLSGFRTNQQIVDSTLNLHGFDPTPKTDTAAGKKQAAEVAQFYRIIDQRVGALAQSSGKKPSNDDVQRIADETMRTFAKPASGGNDWIPFNERSASLFDITIGDIPTTDVDDLRAAYKARYGTVPNDGAIIALYQEKQRRGTK